MKTLINNQVLRIDDHHRGAKEAKTFDKSSSDVHLEKITKAKVDGKRIQVKIKAPLNSERPIQITGDNQNLNKIPRKLKKEIQKAFSNKEKRDKFIKDVAENLNNYESILEDEEKVRKSLERLGNHFDLNWTGKEISSFVNGKLVKRTELYNDKDEKIYFATIDSKYMTIGELDGYSKHSISLSELIKNK